MSPGRPAAISNHSYTSLARTPAIARVILSPLSLTGSHLQSLLMTGHFLIYIFSQRCFLRSKRCIMVTQPSQCLKVLIMVYANSTGAVDRRRYVNIDHRTACAGKLHAPAMCGDSPCDLLARDGSRFGRRRPLKTCRQLYKEYACQAANLSQQPLTRKRTAAARLHRSRRRRRGPLLHPGKNIRRTP